MHVTGSFGPVSHCHNSGSKVHSARVQAATEYRHNSAISSTISTNPFLAVRVYNTADGPRVPLLAQAKQVRWKESVLGHDDEICEESTTGLYHADLTVCHADQPVSKHTSRLILQTMQGTTAL